MRKFSPRYYDIDVDPCTKYVIKVLASEDYQVWIKKCHKKIFDLREGGRTSRPTPWRFTTRSMFLSFEPKFL